MSEAHEVLHAHDDQEETDGCLCDLKLDEADTIPDDELPSAAGGIEAEEKVEDVEGESEHLDNLEIDPTADDELPVAVGGV